MLESGDSALDKASKRRRVVGQREKTTPCGTAAPIHPCGHERAWKEKPAFS